MSPPEVVTLRSPPGETVKKISISRVYLAYAGVSNQTAKAVAQRIEIFVFMGIGLRVKLRSPSLVTRQSPEIYTFSPTLPAISPE
jgi:hypothetical protein